jgi:hypothetical protein
MKPGIELESGDEQEMEKQRQVCNGNIHKLRQLPEQHCGRVGECVRHSS